MMSGSLDGVFLAEMRAATTGPDICQLHVPCDADWVASWVVEPAQTRGDALRLTAVSAVA